MWPWQWKFQLNFLPQIFIKIYSSHTAHATVHCARSSTLTPFNYVLLIFGSREENEHNHSTTSNMLSIAQYVKLNDAKMRQTYRSFHGTVHFRLATSQPSYWLIEWMSSLRSIDSLHSAFVHAVSVKKEDSNKHCHGTTASGLNRPEECRIFHILLQRSLDNYNFSFTTRSTVDSRHQRCDVWHRISSMKKKS